MEWMNISYMLAFLSVFIASVSQILLKQSAQTEQASILFSTHVSWVRDRRSVQFAPF